MKRKFVFMVVLGWACGLLSAQNFIQNPDFDKHFEPECRFDMTPGALKVSVFTEDSTWNKCLKLEVKAYHKQKDGAERIFGTVRIGGDKKNNGFAVKPNTVYSYSLELKGNATVGIGAVEWEGPDYWKDMKKLKLTGADTFKASDEWTTLNGSFQTGPKTTHAAIGVSFWGEARWKNLPPIGSFVLIDKVKVVEKADLFGGLKKKQGTGEQGIPLERVALQGGEALQRFADYKTGRRAEADTIAEFRAGENSIRLKIRCLEPMMDKLQASVKEDGANPWKDDCVEIFFAPVVKDRVLSQFVVAAGGGRWMGRGTGQSGKEFDRWSANVSREKDAWVVDAEIPYTLLGWEKRPEPGSEIRFNLARTRKAVPEVSSWSFAGSGFGFHDLSRFGVILLDSPEAWRAKTVGVLTRETTDPALLKKITSWTLTGDLSEDYRQAQLFRKEINISKLGDRNFVVTQTAPTLDPSIPFLPATIAAPPSKIVLRAAGNEFKALPLAVTNVMDRAEEYRIVVSSMSPRGGELGGLKTAGGEMFPSEKIKLFRGVRVKDGDEEKHGLRFDPLAPMDVTSTVVVLPNESTPVWVIFNTQGIKAGRYDGMIRVIPLGQRASMEKEATVYKGPMLDLPIEFEVLPFELDRKPPVSQFLFQRAFNKECFDMLMEYGSDSVLVNTWGFRVSFHKDGSIAGRDTQRAEEEILCLKEWAAGYGMEKNLKIGVAYGAYTTFRDVHSKKQFKSGTPEWTRAWSEYVKVLEDIRRKCGIPNENFFVEIWDEPHEKDMEELTLASRAAHETVPGLNFMVTLAAWDIPLPKLEQLIPFFSHWCLWSTKFFTEEKYAPLMKKLRTSRKNISFYTCETIMRQDLYKYYRSHPWTAAAYELDMSNMYQFMTYLSERRDWKMTSAGEMARMASGHPVSSIRQECLRIGGNDLKYMRKLAEVLKNAGTKDAKLRAEAEAFLKDIPAKVGIRMKHDPDQAEIAREQAIDYILKLIR